MSVPRLNSLGRFLLLVTGLGGFLYGVDIGIIAAAIPYLNQTINLTLSQTSAIVAAVLGGSMVASPLTGALADWLGRRRIMIFSGALFVGSVGLIVVSQSFASLLTGRLLQGMSGGVIAVVVPLYLAETLPANYRGRATAFFQFLLTVGIALSALVGWFYTTQAERAVIAAGHNAQIIAAAQNHAWRSMFFAVVYPGALFLLGSFLLPESPRWLLTHGRREQAAAVLRKLGIDELQEGDQDEQAISAASPEQSRTPTAATTTSHGSLLQRRYLYPFLLACVILACNQTTGINSILQFLVVILRQAGLSVTHATEGDVIVKVLNCVMTVVAISLVDRKGRKFLLKLGTAGIVLSLTLAGCVFLQFEHRRTDVTGSVQSRVLTNRLLLPAHDAQGWNPSLPSASLLTILYSYGDGTHLASAAADSSEVLNISPQPGTANAPLRIVHAYLTPRATQLSGTLIAICLGLFIASFAVGPGVVVWLTLSELMPMRIRSTGMGFALLLNQGVSTAIAAVFLPEVGRHGYYSMFFFWAACTVVYFLTAAFFLPETRGKTLEEIELSFQ